MHKFKAGAKVCMKGVSNPVLTVQFVRDDDLVVVCSYIKDDLIHTVELNPLLLDPILDEHNKPLHIPVSWAV